MNRIAVPLPVLCLALAASLACAAVPARATGDSAIAAPDTAEPADAAWAATPAGKPGGSGIRVSYIAPPMQPGRAGSVQLQFRGVRGDDARAEWRAPEGATVLSAALGNATALALPRGQVTVVTLEVTPGIDGMAYLDVFTTQNGRGSAQSIPIKVGSGIVRLKREGTAMTMPSGEAVVSLPSQPK